ncbi:MAG: hypothetical protein AAFR36_28965, partial [Bacteroidota bacterium]
LVSPGTSSSQKNVPTDLVRLITYDEVSPGVSSNSNPISEKGELRNATLNTFDLDEICSWAGADQSICRGDEGVAIGFDADLPENMECWEDYCVKWEPEQGLDNPYVLNPMAAPVETTSYTIHITDNDGHYYGSDEVLVEVIANPVPIITPATPWICGTDQVTLYGSIAGGFEGYTILWSPINESTPSVTIDQPGSYILQVTDSNTGCEAETTVVVENAELTAVISSAFDKICPEGELLLQPQVEGSPGPFDYLWSNGSISSSLIIDQAGEYELTVTDRNNGCEANAAIEISTYEPVVEMLGASSDNENTLDDLVILPDNQVICPNNSFDLAVEGSFVSVNWTTTGSIGTLLVEGDGSTALYTASADEESVTVTVTVTLEDGCEVSDVVTFNNAELADNAVGSFIDDIGFYCIDITILSEAARPNTPQQRNSLTLCEEDDCADEDVVCVRDDARLRIAVSGEDVGDLGMLVNDYLSYFTSEYEYPSARAYITYEGDACACADGGNYLATIQDDFEEDELAFWFIITGDSAPNSPGRLCVLANVPASEEHYPVAPDKREFVDFSLQVVSEDEDDGGLGSEGKQRLFTVCDANLDNWLGYASHVAPGDDAILCNGALQNNPWVVAPSGIPMRMPAYTALSWIYAPPRGALPPTGTLAGFTDWVEEGGITRPRYFGARISRPLLLNPDDPELDEADEIFNRSRFTGYQRYGTRRDLYLEGIYNSIVLTDVGEYEEIEFFSAGIPNNPVFPTSIEFFACSPRIPAFIDNMLIPQGHFTDGAGPPLSASTVVDNWDDSILLDPNNPWGGVNQTLPTAEITDVKFSGVVAVDPGTDASVFRLKHQEADGSIVYSFVLAFFNEFDQLELRLYNCFSGSYDLPISSTVISPVFLQTMSGYTMGNQFSTQDVANNEVELGRPFLLELSPEQAGALGLTYSPNSSVIGSEIDPTSQIANYGFANMADLQIFADEAARGLGMGEARINTQFIISADDKVFIDPETEDEIDIDGEAAARNFLTGEMSRVDGTNGDKPDMKLFVHFTVNGGAIVGLRFAEDFYTLTEALDENGETILVDVSTQELNQPLILQNLAFERWEQALFLQATSAGLDETVDGCSLLDECSDDTERRPWFIGKRPGTPPLNLANITGELGAIGADFMKDGMISEAFVMTSLDNGQEIPFIMEGPEVGVGFANTAASANPVVGFYQLGTFGWSVFTDKQLRQGLVQALSSPTKLARAMYEDKKNAYFGDNEEKKLWAAGTDVGGIFAFFASGGGTAIANLSNKIKNLGKKADDAARKLADDLPVDANDVDIDSGSYQEMVDAFKKNDLNESDGFTPAEVDAFWKDFMGANFVNEPGHARKIMANPYLAKWWKRFKDAGSFDFCAVDFSVPPFYQFVGLGGDNKLEETTLSQWTEVLTILVTECINFADFVRQLPEPPASDFYNKLKTTFPDTPDGMEKAGKFIDDVKNSNSSFFARISGNPRLLDAWEICSVDEVVRKDIDRLEKVA